MTTERRPPPGEGEGIPNGSTPPLPLATRGSRAAEGPRAGGWEGAGGWGVPLDAFGRLRAALASARPGGPSGGVGCHYWTRPTLGVPADQLEVLGLVRIIKSRVPTCEEHGCAIIATCTERKVFAERGPGIGRRKFRLTPLGTRAAAEPSVLAELIAEEPLARRILEAVREASGPTSWLELYWHLLQPELDALEASGLRSTPPLSRSAVRFYLDLLVTAGLVAEDATMGVVWPPASHE